MSARRALRLAILAASIVVALPSAARAETVLLPGVAAGPGQNDTHWETEIWLVNLTGETRSVGWLAFPTGAGTCVRPAVEPPTIEIPAGATVRLPDPLAGVGTSGFVELALPTGVLARGRTANVTPSGSLGQGLPLLRPHAFAPANATQVLGGVRRDDGFRTNLLLVSPESNCTAGEAVPATVIVRGPDGAVRSETLVWMPSRSQFAVWDALDGAGNCSVGCRIDVTSPVPLYAFASVVDNATGDPTTVTPDF